MTTPAVNDYVREISITVLATEVTGMPFATVTWCDGRIDVRTRVLGRADRPRTALAGKLTEYIAAGGRSSSAKPWTRAASSWLATAPGPAAATAAATFNR